MLKFIFSIANAETTTENYQQLKSVQPRVTVEEFTIAAVRSEGAIQTNALKKGISEIMEVEK